MYDPQIEGKRLTFGVSGRLYKSALVMYDRQTESLWGQILQQAIAGPMTGTKLNMLPAEHTTWEDWRRRHPNTLVLSPHTGFDRDYGLSPYERYWRGGEPRFRTKGPRSDSKLKPMARVVGVDVGGVQKAYAFDLLKQKGELLDVVGGRRIRVHFNPRSESAHVTDENGRLVPSLTLFWFAWQDFYPKTELAEAAE